MPRMNNRSGGGGNHNHNNPHSSSPGSYSNNSPGSGQMPAAPPPPPPPPPPQQQQQQQPQQQQQQQQPPQQQPPPTPLPSGGPPPPQLHHFHHHHHSQGGYGGNSSSDGSPMMMDNLPRGGPIYPGSGNNPPPPHMQGGGGGQHQMQNNNNNNGNWGMSQNARYPPTPGPQGGPNGGNNMPGPGMQQQPQQQQMVPPPMMRHGPMNNNQHQQPPQGGYYNHGGDYPPPPPPMSGGSNYYSPPPPPPGPYNNNNGGNMSPPPPNGSFRGGGGGPPMPMDSSYAQPLRSPHMGYSGGGGGGGPMDMNAPPQSPPPPGGYNNNNVRGQVGNHQQNHSGNQQHHNMMHGGGPGPQSMQGGPRPGYHPNNNNGPNNSAPYHNNNNNNGNPSPPSVQGSSTNNPSVGNNNSNMNANSNPNVRSGGMSSSPMPGPMNNNNMGGNHPPMSNYNGMPLPPPPPPMQQQQQQQQQQQMQQGMGPMGPPTPNNNHNMLRMNQPNNSNNNMMGYGPMGGNGGGDGGWQQPSQPPVPLPRGAASGQGYHHNNNNNMQQGMMPMQQSMMPPQSGGRVGRNNGGSMHRNHRNNNNGGLNHHHSQHQSNNMNGPNMNGNMMNMMGPPAGMMATPMPGPGGVPPNMPMMPMGADGMHGMLPPGGFHTPQPPNLPTPNPAAEEVPIPPLLSLYDFLKDRMLLKEGRLSEFFPPGHDPVKDGPVHIAVDGNYMMTTIRSRLLQRDPLWFLHSPLPDQLLALVRENVEQMRAKNLEPIWVFNGIGVSGDVEAFLPSPKELQVRDAVWGKLNIGELPTHEEIAEAFDTSSSLGEDVLMAVQRFLRSEFGVLTVTSPFINWCQMITFLKEGDVQLVMGPAEMMMLPYEPMQVIAEIDLVGDAVAYFDRNEVLHRLFPHQIRGTDTSAAGDRMLDFGMLIATHPAISAARANLNLTTEAIYEELASGVPHYVSLRDFITQFEHGGPGASGVNGSSDRARTGSEVLKHSKGRTYLQYSPVFSKQCKEPVVYFKRVFDPNLTIKNMPNNLSGVFGNLVPLFLFFCQYCGLLSVSFMTIITQSYFRDDFPVSDTTNYHHHLPTLVALRGQILYQIVLKMTDSVYKQRLEKVSWVRWFDNILMVVARPAENITLDEWNVSTMEDLDTMELSDIHISKVLSLTNSVTCIPESQVPLRGVPNHQPIYRGTRQTYFAILLKVFDFLGYFSHAVVAPPVITARSDADGEESGEGPAASTSEPAGEAADSADATGATAGGADGGAVDEMDDDDRKPDNNTAFTVYLCRSLAQCPPEFQSALVRLTELVRVEIINSSPCCYISSNDESEQAQVSQTPEKPPVVVEKSPEAAEGEEDGKDDVAPDQHLLDNEDSPPVLLAARIATLVTVPYLDASGSDEMEWAPVYSRHLCAFSVMVRAMNRSLRELVEVISTSVFLTGLSDCPLMGCCDLLQALPFGDIPSAIGGLLLHYVLVFPADYENQCRSVEDRWEYLQAKFKHIPNLPAELKRVMEFTFQALFLLNAFCKYDPGAVTAEDLRNTYVVSDALHLLYSKWKLHIKEPAPEDIHNLWSPAS